MAKKIKSLFSILLLFSLIIVPSIVKASNISEGSGEAKEDGTKVTHVAGGNVGTTNNIGLRLLLVRRERVLTEFSGEDYFSVDQNKGIKLKDDISGCVNYTDLNRWVYWFIIRTLKDGSTTDGNNHADVVHASNGTSLYKGLVKERKYLVQQWSVVEEGREPLTETKLADRTAFLKYLNGLTGRELYKYAKFFGLATQEEITNEYSNPADYYFVVEGFSEFTSDGTRIAAVYNTEYYLGGREDKLLDSKDVVKDISSGEYKLPNTLVDRTMKDTLGGKAYSKPHMLEFGNINRGSISPGDSNGYHWVGSEPVRWMKLGYNKSGKPIFAPSIGYNYTIYSGAFNSPPSDKAVNPITFIYTGKAGTSDREKAELYGGVMSYEGGYDNGTKQFRKMSIRKQLGISSKTDLSAPDLDQDFCNFNMTPDKAVKFDTVTGELPIPADFKLDWSNKNVSDGDMNFGKMTRIVKVNGQPTRKYIHSDYKKLTKENNATNIVTTNNVGGRNIIDSIYNAALAKLNDQFIAVDSFDKDKLQFRKNKIYGVPVAILYKGNEVISTKHKLIMNKNGSITDSSEKKHYTSSKSESFYITPESSYFMVFKKDDDIGLSKMKSKLKGVNVYNIKDVLEKIKGKNKNITLSNKKGIRLGVGHYKTKKDINGYVIYEIVLSPPLAKGFLKLPSYMLNKYFDSAIQTSSLLAPKPWLVRFNLVTDYTNSKETVLKYPNYNFDYGAGKLAEVERESINGSTYIVTEGKDWNIEYKDISKGATFSHDTGTKRGYYFPIATSVLEQKNGVVQREYRVLWSDRHKLENWYNENTLKFKQPPFIVDYAFNLVRGVVNDKRAISGITYSEYNEGIKKDKNDLLLIKDKFGVVPVAGSLKTLEKRNPNAVAKTILDNFHFTSRYRYTGSKDGTKSMNMKEKPEIWKTRTVTYTYTDENGEEQEGSYEEKYLAEVSWWYYTDFSPTKVQGYNTGSDAEYSLYSDILKYTTVKIDTGINTYLKDKKHKGILEYARPSEQNKLTKGKEYRYSVAKYNGNKLYFYPEVNMVYKIGGTTYDNAPYNLVSTIGEEKRSVDSSSMYLYKINQTGEIKGTTYSDASLGGTSSLGNSKITVPSGADVHVTADTQAFTVDLYGYSLDLVDPSDKEYKNIVKSEANIIMPWGNNTNHKKALKEHFDKWANDTLNIKNYSADFELKTGKNSISNFSATVGKIVKGSTKEDGIYNLVIANGVLQETDSYLKMIQQIMQDYDCTELDAKALFNTSGIYQSIAKAIESSNDTFNNSGSADKWTNILGGNDKWYDEKVRTFVIRRYTHLGNKIKDITASDKIDFGLGNTSEMGRINRDGGNTKDASWTVSIFFNSAEKTNLESLLDLKTLYRPSKQKSRTAIQEPNKNHSVLINHVPVKNAEFTISASGTGDF